MTKAQNLNSKFMFKSFIKKPTQINPTLNKNKSRSPSPINFNIKTPKIATIAQDKNYFCNESLKSAQKGLFTPNMKSRNIEDLNSRQLFKLKYTMNYLGDEGQYADNLNLSDSYVSFDSDGDEFSNVSYEILANYDDDYSNAKNDKLDNLDVMCF